MPPPPRLIRWVLSLAVFYLGAMTLLRLVTYYMFRGPAADSLSQAWPVFQLGLRFDLRVIAAALLPLVALGTFRRLDPFRSRFARGIWLVLLGVFSLALIVFYLSDFLHYRYVGQRLNASVLGFVADARITTGMVMETYPVGWMVLGVLVSLALAVWTTLVLHRRAACAIPPATRRFARGSWYTLIVVGSVVAVFGRIGQFPLRWSDAFNLRSEASANLALNPVESFISSLKFRTAGYSREKVSSHYPRMAEYLGVEQPDSARLDFTRNIRPRLDAGPKRPNIVLVLCESFSGYKSSMWGNALDPTPFFAGLTQQGLFFDNCFTPHFGTARGVWALITGIPDVSPVSTASRNPAMVDQHTIVNEFEGYEKLYFLGGSSSWANIRGLLTNNIAGLKLYEEGSYDAPRIDVWGISDKNLFLEANRVLQTQTEPFFAIIQTADNHRPYTIPDEDLDEFGKVEVPAEMLRENGFESSAELNAFRYTDFAFRKFVEAARAAPYFDNTIFVFIGDHGIGGNAGTMFPPGWTTNHLTRYHVPLLFYGPAFFRPQRVHAVASMVDVLPTIAGFVGIGYRNATMGRDLLERQRVDQGAGNIAFIMDHNDRTIGVMKGAYYGRQQPAGRHDMVWADSARDAVPGPVPPDAREYQREAEVFHEVARFMLLNNKKPAGRKAAASTVTHAR